MMMMMVVRIFISSKDAVHLAGETVITAAITTTAAFFIDHVVQWIIKRDGRGRGMAWWDDWSSITPSRMTAQLQGVRTTERVVLQVVVMMVIITSQWKSAAAAAGVYCVGDDGGIC